MYDDRIVVTSGCPIHIPFRVGVLSVTSTLSPQQCTMHTDSTQL